MPKNQFQRMIFALLTVIVTVHAYVFYSLYVVNGNYFLSVEGASGVIDGIRLNGGVMALGSLLPIWAVILLEFCLAYILECVVGSPCSFKLACKVFDPEKTHPVLFETTIICATVGIMCPAMSFLAALIYYPYYVGFDVFTLLANWLKLVCYNFPFAFLLILTVFLMLLNDILWMPFSTYSYLSSIEPFLCLFKMSILNNFLLR